MKMADEKPHHAHHRFTVGVMGEFDSGKSSIINALVGSAVLPVDILPCTAVPTRVMYDRQPHAKLIMRDGGAWDISADCLADCVTMLTEEGERRAMGIEEAVVALPCGICENGMDLVDTPGLNNNSRMDEIAESTIPKLDAVIMLITPGTPFSLSMEEFIFNRLITSDIKRLIFVLNRIDTIKDATARTKFMKRVTAKIKQCVFEKLGDTCGPNAQEFEEAVLTKMGGIKVFPVSARDALKGKLSGDENMIQESGINELEAALTRLMMEYS